MFCKIILSILNTGIAYNFLTIAVTMLSTAAHKQVSNLKCWHVKSVNQSATFDHFLNCSGDANFDNFTIFDKETNQFNFSKETLCNML